MNQTKQAQGIAEAVKRFFDGPENSTIGLSREDALLLADAAQSGTFANEGASGQALPTGQELALFEAWFDSWRRSTWVPFGSDPRMEMPAHWNINAGHHMEIAFAAGRASAQQPPKANSKELPGLSDDEIMDIAEPFHDINGVLFDEVAFARALLSRQPTESDK